MQFRLSGLEGLLGDSSVARSKRFFDLAQESANPRTASLVDIRAARDLAGRLLRRNCIGHGCLSSNSNSLRHRRVGLSV